MVRFAEKEELGRVNGKQTIRGNALTDYPVIEFDEGEAPVLDPIKMVGDRRLGSDKLVITFFPEVMEKLKGEKQIALEDVVEGENPAEIYRFVGSDVLITLGFVGCPACAGNLEVFYAMGIRKVMFCGGGGVLDKNIEVGTPLIVEGAIRDEGFSYQYIAPGRVLYTEERVNAKIAGFLEKRGIPYIKGLVWTTDALFRETPARIKRRKQEGAKIVEMEQSGCIAIAQYRGFNYGAIIYGGDDVSGEDWDQRGWNTKYGIRYDLVQICRELVGTL